MLEKAIAIYIYERCSIYIGFEHVAQMEVENMSTEEKRKYLHEMIDKLAITQIERLYQLVRGMFGKTV